MRSHSYLDLATVLGAAFVCTVFWLIFGYWQLMAYAALCLWTAGYFARPLR